MKSIKPGRGPSMMGGVMSIAMGLFGIVWTFIAASMGAGPFALFGVIFIGIAVAQAIHNFKNATGENRYSVYDIVDGSEEPDPLNVRFGGDDRTGPVRDEAQEQHPRESLYCPYCGAAVEGDYIYCNKCGRKLP